jgi:hypothetical protein
MLRELSRHCEKRSFLDKDAEVNVTIVWKNEESTLRSEGWSPQSGVHGSASVSSLRYPIRAGLMRHEGSLLNL